MPIVQYNDRQEGPSTNPNQALAQLNAFLLEEILESSIQASPSKGNSPIAHWNCDCAQCI